MNALLLILISVLPSDRVARESCDRIELNSFYDDQARLVFDQVLFFDWSHEEGRYQLRGWRMVKSESQLPRLDHARGVYVCDWQDGEVHRIVTAPVLSVSRTQYDPELTEREFLPKERRRELRSPKTLHQARK